jgi:hypothetical protein
MGVVASGLVTCDSDELIIVIVGVKATSFGSTKRHPLEKGIVKNNKIQRQISSSLLVLHVNISILCPR